MMETLRVLKFCRKTALFVAMPQTGSACLSSAFAPVNWRRMLALFDFRPCYKCSSRGTTCLARAHPV